MSEKVTSLASGHEGTLGDQVRGYVGRVKGGEMGSLPAVFGIIILTAVFQTLSPFFITKLNFANLFVYDIGP